MHTTPLQHVAKHILLHSSDCFTYSTNRHQTATHLPPTPSPTPTITQSIAKHIPPHVLVVECVFLDQGTIKSAFAKRARGLMARFACTSGITCAADVGKLTGFDVEGYRYSAAKSTDKSYVFERAAPPPKAKKAPVKKTAAQSKAKKGQEVDDCHGDDGEGEDKSPPAKKAKKAPVKAAAKGKAKATKGDDREEVEVVVKEGAAATATSAAPAKKVAAPKKGAVGKKAKVEEAEAKAEEMEVEAVEVKQEPAKEGAAPKKRAVGKKAKRGE
jgi:hypothetical protein